MKNIFHSAISHSSRIIYKEINDASGEVQASGPNPWSDPTALMNGLPFDKKVKVLVQSYGDRVKDADFKRGEFVFSTSGEDYTIIHNRESGLFSIEGKKGVYNLMVLKKQLNALIEDKDRADMAEATTMIERMQIRNEINKLKEKYNKSGVLIKDLRTNDDGSISVYINQVHGYGGKSFSVTIKKDFQFYIDQNLLAERSSAKSSHEAIMKELGYDPNNILKIPGGSKIPKEGMHDLLKGRSENM